MGFDPLRPYNELPLLPPQTDLETKSILKKTVTAGRALAELKGLGDTIPDQNILINSLVLQEAKASSEIENIITTNDALFKAFSSGVDQTDPATKEVLRYREALWDAYNMYLSKYIIERKMDYYHLLRNVTTDGSWEPWILYLLDAVENTAIFTRERILAIRNLMTETMGTAREKLPGRVYSKELIELIFRQPYTKVQFLVEAGIAERQTAAEYLKELERIDILKAYKAGRETLYLNTKLYELLSQ
ncbi:MAG: Fic/DOC family N-terminal domain-containing protein [bacterium]|nr:Fic/DOC family N-terminal domain-containing protein [bacterium]